MWNPKYFHEMITNRVIITMVRVARASPGRGRPSPTCWRLESTSAPGRRSSENTMPVIASDRTYGQEEQQPEDRPAREAPVQQDRQRQRERDLDRQRQGDDEEVVARPPS